MAAPTKLAHVVFRTGQLPTMRDWYCAVFEAEVVFQNDQVAFATYDDEHHRLAFIAIPVDAPSPPQPTGVDHVAFTYASMADLLDTYERLAGLGITPHWTINHGPTTSMYYRDPDGNQVELQIDNFETAAEVDAFLQSPTFAENPIGVEYDADRLLERFSDGDPIEELVKQGSA